ncbi:MAG TPA: NTP transferase domain-containing protein, partial [Actinophytocola sp.]|uniref:nucleotidyltransferase family protein n=1 Tax=Actinophytocola sp. TaxID=1872138 RepID=UPI002DDDA35C
AGVVRDGGCAPVVVVVGAGADEVRATANLGGVSVVDNPEWESGMGSSLRVGLAALSGVDVVAALVVPVDTPGMTVEAVRRVRGLAGPGVLARATYDGVPGHPVLIGREHWAGVCELATGDAGARPYLKVHPAIEVPCGDVASGLDVDRPEDLP